MERVLAAGLLAMVISILAGPKFIDFLRRNEFGQMIREEGPAGHAVKQGTPTAGGLMVVVSMTVPFLALSHWTPEGLPVGVMLASRPAEEELLLSLSAQVEAAAPWVDRKAQNRPAATEPDGSITFNAPAVRKTAAKTNRAAVEIHGAMVCSRNREAVVVVNGNVPPAVRSHA